MFAIMKFGLKTPHFNANFWFKIILNQRAYQTSSEPCGNYDPQGSGTGVKAGFSDFSD